MFGRFVLLGVACAFLPGCAIFGGKPMPERLDDEAQRRCDYGWGHFVARSAEADRTAMMDTLLLMRAWEAGVDRLHLRSEKQVGDVFVVMETRFERDLPDDDAFSIAFYDADGRLLRQESYTRAEIDAAIELYVTLEGEMESETPEERAARLARLAERAARLQQVEELFPTPPEPDDAEETDDPEAGGAADEPDGADTPNDPGAD